jgi:hypothetical protein
LLWWCLSWGDGGSNDGRLLPKGRLVEDSRLEFLARLLLPCHCSWIAGFNDDDATCLDGGLLEEDSKLVVLARLFDDADEKDVGCGGGLLEAPVGTNP